MVKPWRCPHCRSRAGVPVRYGLPNAESAAAAARGEVVLGGCVLTDDDPPRCCLECRAALWRGGVFAIPGAGDDRRVVLHRRGRRRLEASVDIDFAVTVSWRDLAGPTEEPFAVPSHLADVLVLLLTLEMTTDGPALRRWLSRHGLGFVGDLEGRIESFGITADGMVSFSSADGDLLLHASTERYLLHLVRATYRREGIGSIAEFRDWLAVRGLDVAGLAQSYDD